MQHAIEYVRVVLYPRTRTAIDNQVVCRRVVIDVVPPRIDAVFAMPQLAGLVAVGNCGNTE